MFEKMIQRYQAGMVAMLRSEAFTMRGEFDRYLRKLLRSESDSTTQLMREQVAHVHDAINNFSTGEYRNIQLAMQKLAVEESATFALKNMLKASAFSHPLDTLRHGLSLAPRGGMALEFGVFSGSTLKIIAEARSGDQVFGFDSFEGLPELWRSGFPAGAFAVDNLPQVPGAQLVVGWFNESLPGFLGKHPGPVDFLHIDCDLYSSTKTVFDLVGPRLRVGSVVVFDEFFNYPGWQHHEAKAWEEYLLATGTECSYEAYTFNNEQIALRITAL